MIPTLFIQSPLLLDAKIQHGFSTRLGGVSQGRYASLNLGAKWGDAPENVAENRRRLAQAAGFSLDSLQTARQVHGDRVLQLDGAPVHHEEADGLAACTRETVMGVFTADCVPLLLSDGEGRAAAVHAGWRGTVARIAARAVEALESLGARRERLLAAIGPSICVRCFEVGEEVAAQFGTVAPDAVVRGGTKPHVDLWAANRTVLIASGLSPTRIDAAPPCTMCDRDRFFSFRRDGGSIGQQLSWIAS